MKYSTESIFHTNYRNQVISIISINLLTISHGICLGWVSPMIALLQSDDSPLGRKISVSEASWIGACISIGAVAGSILFGFCMDSLGRKKTLLLLACPHTLYWITVFFSTESYHFYIARVLAGLSGGGCFVAMPIFTAEIADNLIRGRLGSMFILNYNLGILLGFIIASYVNYKIAACTIATIPIAFFLFVLRLPDTPQFLIRNYREEDAKEALMFYMNVVHLRGNIIQLDPFKRKFDELRASILNSQGGQTLAFKDFYNSRVIKAISIGFILMMLNQLCGAFAIVNYSSIMFAQSGSNMDPNTNTIILGVMQILGTYTSITLVDKYGRKILLITSVFGMCIGLSAAGVYEHLSQYYDLTEYSWVPLGALSFAIYIACIGIVPVTFVITVELVPAKIRPTTSAFFMVSLSLISIAILKFFPVLLASIGFSGIMATCASFCALGGIFVVTFVPETKGKENAIGTQNVQK